MTVTMMVTIKLLAATFLCVINIPFSLQIAAVGVDWGEEFIKVSAVHPGRSLDIVLTPSGQRKFINSLALNGDYRLFCSESRQKLHRNPTYTLDSRIPINDKFNLSFTTKVDENTSLHWSEIAANMLSHISDQIEVDKKSLVMAIPSSYGLVPRAVLSEAITLAGFNHLAFIDQAVAAGLARAQSLKNATVAMIYDLGEDSGKVSILSISPRDKANKTPPSVTLLGTGVLSGIGGRHHDQVLRQLIMDKAKTPSYFEHIPLGDYKKKLGLSDNVTIHGIGGKEFVTITKVEFESALKPSLELLKNPIDIALNMANKALSDLESVEIIGGAWRIPIVKEFLEQAIKPHSLSIHLNADEAIAMGAGLVAASLSSKSFFSWNEISSSPLLIKVFYSCGKDDKPVFTEEIFPAGSPLFNSKTITIEVKSDFSISFYDKNTESSVFKEGFPRYIITGIDSVKKPAKDSEPVEPVEPVEPIEDNRIYKVNIIISRDSKSLQIKLELLDESSEDKSKNKPLKVKRLDSVSSKIYAERKTTLVNYINKDMQYNNRLIAHSNLESSVYSTYNLLQPVEALKTGQPIDYYKKSKLENFFKDEERKNIKDQAQKIEEWLEMNGHSATLAELEDKLKLLNAPIAPAKSRQVAFNQWLNLISLLKKESNQEILDMYQTLIKDNPDDYGKPLNTFSDWLDVNLEQNITTGLPNLSAPDLMNQTAKLKKLIEARANKLKADLAKLKAEADKANTTDEEKSPPLDKEDGHFGDADQSKDKANDGPDQGETDKSKSTHNEL